MGLLNPTKTRLSRTRTEVWVPAFGFEDLYEVSSLGRVRRVVTKLACKAGRVLKGTVNSDGYRQHSLYDQAGSAKTILTSRLVLSSFTQDSGNGMQARHLNGRCLDNRRVNLAWGTHAENEEDKRRHGTHSRGESHGGAKLSEEEVRAIRRRGRTRNAIALGREFGVSQTTVLDILHYRIWRHI